MNNGNLRSMRAQLPLGTDPLSVRLRIEALERMLEGMIRVPVLGRKVGLDALLGLVPVAGDALAAVLGLYIVWEGRNLGMSRWPMSDKPVLKIGIPTGRVLDDFGADFPFMQQSQIKLAF